jgi:zinc transport system substrate-binding protein
LYPRKTTLSFPSLFVLCLLFLVPMSLWAGGSQAPQEFVVYASTPPQAYMVQRILGDLGRAFPIIQPGQDAHTFDPSPREIQRLGGAQAIFITGLEFEEMILGPLTRANRNLQVIDLRQGITMRQLEAHWHDPNVPHAHAEGNPDPHIWLGPREVRLQAQTIRDGLIRLLPDNRTQIEQGYRSFMVDVDRVTAELEQLLTPLRGKAVLVYHPAFGYLTDTFGITQLAIEAGGREPSPRLLQQTIERALAAGVTIIFSQPEYEQTAARAVARAIGAEIVMATDLDENWVELMLSIGRNLAQIGQD